MIRLFNLCLFISAFIFSGIHTQSVQDSIIQGNISEKSNIRLHTYIESESVPMNLEVVYHIELKWSGELSRYKIGELKEPAATNLTHRGSGSRNIVSTDKDGTPVSIKRITYYFKPVEIGMAYIDGMTIKYVDSETGYEGNLMSSRIGVKIVDPLPEPGDKFGIRELMLIIIVLVIIGSIIFFIFRYRKQKERQKKTVEEVMETIEEKYIRLLKETIQFNSQNIKENIIDLSHLLTGYFSEKYDILAANLATDDLIHLLSDKDVNEETLSRIKNFFTQANLVKFAGTVISESEFHVLYDIVELILESQKENKDTGGIEDTKK